MSSYRRYNYRAYPTQGQREALSCLYGACRYAYNWTLDQRELMRRRHGRMQSCTQLSNMFVCVQLVVAGLVTMIFRV
ncbi:helix-turn-helix domain-containing protein [Bifidobacterium longum]|uniref:helix-turn-helix domain-containing protein n=1 Tax=Bifidobacterium longum TaxID=216816 RepID=UPI001E62CCC2|nr:helix-turn-helix domain-containing protein [Bifidobacterium longum]MDB6542424.1 helix-turn-helix domain-containing protein [Bifidobacterium longum]MDB6546325.1 helix-turn-helix domain-containing protein [Bifidobacterium longum]MDB6548489.1 helix-turn-helix domain-containing protein [Bifidobacterium longum]MDB6550587.1 helix-turn-helix domain-containing protein [Bifidobacterium longum]MDB6552848.1 helix-turn-helix domain-containing protein [Bifidobacterium longum]